MNRSPSLLSLSMGLLAFNIIAGQTLAQPPLPSSRSAELEQAAATLATSKFSEAEQAFAAIAENPTNAPLVRGLALQGEAQSAIAREDYSTAARVWQRMAGDPQLPTAHRDFAQRQLTNAKASRARDAAWDKSAYREPLPSLPKPGLVLFVAPGGSAAADGTATRPFGALSQARDAVRRYKQTHGGMLPKGGVKLSVRGGIYPVTETLKLTAEDSGTADAPVVIASANGQSPVFAGGCVLKGWKPVADPAVLAKLDASVRHQVLEVDLAAHGIVDSGDATQLKRRPELFVDGTPQVLARWPNSGFVKTGEVLGKEPTPDSGVGRGCKDGLFRFIEDRPLTWLDEPDVRLYGYWFWDWFEEYQRVVSIDAGNRSFTLAQPYSNYGYRAGQRYYAVNVFRELDQPGEWYLDRRAGKLYWLPARGTDPAKARCVLSVFAEPFIQIENAERVILLGLTFQEGRGDGIHLGGGAECLIAGCALRRFGGDAVVVEGGRHHGIFGCSMTTLGCGGMRVNGGDRRTLEAGHHFVENCYVADISRIKRTYAPAVHLDGCGNRIAHNWFERIPSSAMRIEGNDHLIELNRIRQVVQESDDQGGIDMFGNPLFRGVVIRWNRWSDIQGGTHCGAAGVRLDDMISGVTIQGNLFERCGAVLFGAVQIHGGKDNLVDGNVFIDCFAGISHSRWGQKRWQKAVEPSLPTAGSPPYSVRYPQLARLSADPDLNQVCRNLFAGCQKGVLRDGGTQETLLNAWTDAKVAPESLSSWKQVRANPALRRILFPPMPVEDMGPYPHPWRAFPSNSLR